MSVVDQQHAAAFDQAQGRTAQANVETAFANFQAADQALALIQFTGGSPTTAAAAARATALASYKTLAAALT